MKNPVIYGITLDSPDAVTEAWIEHCGSDAAEENVVMMNDFIRAIAGFSNDNRIVYDYDKMVEF